MATIYLGKKRRNNSSLFSYRVESGRNIFTGSYNGALYYVKSTFGGSKTHIDFIGRDYMPLKSKELARFEEALRLSPVLGGRKMEEHPVIDHILTSDEE